MNENYFSIIIPVYNGEKHIENCIKKLLKQSYKNFEIIVINDGSTDHTSELVSDFASAYCDTIKQINIENHGVSVARNIGIRSAKGNYLLFIDADDYLDIDALKMLNNILSENHYDMILFGFTVRGSDNRNNDTKVLKKLANNKAVKNSELMKYIISTSNNILGYVWRALYSRTMLINHNVFFPEGIKISEDYMFLLNAVHSSQNILVLDKELYNYCINEDSMSIKYIPSLMKDMMFVNQWMYNTIVKNHEELKMGYYCCVANTYLRFVQNAFRNKNAQFFKICKEVVYKKHFYQIQSVLNIVWKYPIGFNKKSYIGILLFRFHLDFIYWLLFTCKEKIVYK